MGSVANKTVTDKQFTVNAADDYFLGNQQSFSMNRYIISIIDDNSFNGSITIKARPQGTSVTPVGILYKPRYLNGSIGDEVPVNTAITTTSIIEVDASGLDIDVDCTSYTGGSATVYVSKLKG